MKKIIRYSHLLLILLMVPAFSGCGLIQDIFAMGFWAGIIGVVVLILIIWIIASAVRRK